MGEVRREEREEGEREKVGLFLRLSNFERKFVNIGGFKGIYVKIPSVSLKT